MIRGMLLFCLKSLILLSQNLVLAYYVFMFFYSWKKELNIGLPLFVAYVREHKQLSATSMQWLVILSFIDYD